MLRQILICLVMTASVPLWAQSVDMVTAVVGDKAVLRSDVEVQFLRYARETTVEPSFRCDILEDLMLQKLLLNQAEIDSVVVGDDEVDKELEGRVQHFISLFNGSVKQLEEYYGKSVLEIKEEFRPEVREQILAARMQGKVTEHIKVTPSDVKEFFNAIPPDSVPYYNAEVSLGQLIMYARPAPDQDEEARFKLSQIRNRVQAGEDFGTLAYLYSEDPGTSKLKGELPEFGRTDGYAKEFVGAAFKLKNGEISDIVPTSFGYHLIEMMNRKGERVKVRHILITPKVSSFDVESTKSRLDSIRTLILERRLSFSQAVARYSDDEATKNSGGMVVNPATGDFRFEIDQLGALDKDLPFIIDTLRAGQISVPMMYTGPNKKLGCRIVHLTSETLPHRANLKQDYARIQQSALTLKKQEAFGDWVGEKIEKTYVRVDRPFDECDFLYDWKRVPEN